MPLQNEMNDKDILQDPKSFWEESTDSNGESVEKSVDPAEKKSAESTEITADTEVEGTGSANESEGKEDEKKEALTEDHDINATLKEETKDEKPQYIKDSEKIAANWDNLTEEQQQKKLINLKKNRPSTFKAVLENLDLTESEVLPDKKEVKRSEDELVSKLAPVFELANRERFLAETSKYANHNKFTDEEVKVIQDLDGEVYKAFTKAKFDPVTGDELSFVGKLKLALQSNTAKTIIESKYKKPTKNSIDAKMIPSSGERTEKTGDVLQMSDQDILKGFSGESKDQLFF